MSLNCHTRFQELLSYINANTSFKPPKLLCVEMLDEVMKIILISDLIEH